MEIEYFSVARYPRAKSRGKRGLCHSVEWMTSQCEMDGLNELDGLQVISLEKKPASFQKRGLRSIGR